MALISLYFIYLFYFILLIFLFNLYSITPVFISRIKKNTINKHFIEQQLIRNDFFSFYKKIIIRLDKMKLLFYQFESKQFETNF